MVTVLASGIRNVWVHRELLRNLVTKELRVRYRRMGLGMAWAVIDPLALILVYYLAFRFVLGFKDIPNYPLFISIGVIHWTMWTVLLNRSTGAVTYSASILDKVAFPRSLLPLSVVGSNLLQYAYALAAFLVVSPLLDFRVWVGTLLYFPVLALSLVMLTGAAFMFAALTVFFRDLQEIVRIGLRMAFFASPVLYSFDRLSGGWQQFLGALPFAPFLVALRDVLYRNVVPAQETWLLMTAWAVVPAVVGLWLFHRTRLSFVEWL